SRDGTNGPGGSERCGGRAVWYLNYEVTGWNTDLITTRCHIRPIQQAQGHTQFYLQVVLGRGFNNAAISDQVIASPLRRMATAWSRTHIGPIGYPKTARCW